MKYFLGFLASIGLIILVFVLILRGFSGGDEGKRPAPLSNYASTDAIVRLTVDGPIVSEQEHQAYRITVGRSESRVEVLQGYQYDLLNQQSFPNNQESFTQFLKALDFAGYTHASEKAPKDERGACADGDRYILETINGTSRIQRLWASSCRGQGNFKGDVSTVQQLFNAQIPGKEFRKMTSGLNL